MPFPSPQGTQVYVRASTRALAAAGHALTLVCYGHGDGPTDPGLRVVRTPRVPGYRRLRSGPDLVKPALALALARRIAAEPADIVLAHHVEALAAALVARRWTRVPVVWVNHTLLAEELGSYAPALSEAVDHLGGWVDRGLARHADGIVTLSDRAAAWFRATGHPRVHVLPPAIDPGDFADVSPAETPARTLVYAGNPDRYQDLDVIVAAMRHLPDVHLRWVSHAPSAGVGVGEWIQVSGWAAARNLLAGAAVAAVPRMRCGGVPMKLLNALALGVPTVVAEGSALGLPGEVSVVGGDPVAFADGVRRGLAHGRFDPAPIHRRCDWGTVANRLSHIFHETVVSVSRQVGVY